ALELLNKGDSAGARLQVMGVLAQRPNDRVALDLLAQIDTDPHKLLGDKSYAYQIRSGETLSSIAARFLGNSRRFWALARYNGIAVPANAEVGQSIQMPGTAPASAARPPVVPPAAAAPAVAVAEQPRAADPAAASRMRSAGLAEMTRGSIDKAVNLLQRALALNPADTTIQDDLARARKIQQTLRQR
ncbi:MAG: LysM peptidoglycan-binding domain-containing protein, partial [Janthinobacterium lividum]